MRESFFALLCAIYFATADAQPPTSNTDSFGMRQIDQMLDDRPNMNGVFANEHPIVKWAATKFEKGDRGRRVFWDYSQPLSGQPAEHLSPTTECLITIRISNTHESTGLDKWAMLIFEFHNIENAFDRNILEDSLLKNEITVDEFAIGCAKTEYDAMLRTIHFLDENDIRSRATENDHITRQIFETLETFEEDQKRFKIDKENQYDPVRFFAQYGRSLLEYENFKKNVDGGGEQMKVNRKQTGH